MADWPDNADDIGLVITHGSRDFRGTTVDGIIELHDLPKREAGVPYRAGPFPYRGEERGGQADDIIDDDDAVLPVWLWANDDEDPSNLTLEPSIKWGDDDGEAALHVRVEDGEVEVV